MKRLFFFLSLIPLFSNGFAQNYAPVHTNQLKHYFADTSVAFTSFANPEVIGLRTDSFTVSGSDTLIMAYEAEPQLQNPWSCDTASIPPQGFQITKTPISTFFYNEQGDPIYFPNDLVTNSSWIFFAMSNGERIEAKTINKSLMMVNNQLDTVAWVELKHLSSTSTPISSSANDTIRISRSFGLLDFKDWYHYPDTGVRSHLSLVDMEIPSRGEVYDFNVGDIFHYRQSCGNCAPPNHTNVFILNKWFSSNQDTVFYERRVIGESRSLDFSTTPPTVNYFRSQVFDTVYYNALNEKVIQAVFGEMHEHQNTQGHIFNLALRDSASERLYLEGSYGYFYDNTNNCYFAASDQKYSGYGEGIGSTWIYGKFNSSINPYIDERLIYYEKGNISYGTPYNIAIDLKDIQLKVDPLKVYPNPAERIIQIEGIAGNSRLWIFDLSGKQRLESNVNPNSSIAIDQLEAGVYLLQIENQGELFRKKLIVK